MSPAETTNAYCVGANCTIKGPLSLNNVNRVQCTASQNPRWASGTTSLTQLSTMLNTTPRRTPRKNKATANAKGPWRPCIKTAIADAATPEHSMVLRTPNTLVECSQIKIASTKPNA